MKCARFIVAPYLMRVRHCLILALTIWVSANAQPDVLGPDDAAERELGAKLSSIIPAEGEKLINEAVARRAARDGIPEPHARILVNRKLAALAIEQGNWPVAESYLGAALAMASMIEDAGLMIDLSLARSRVRLKNENRGDALADVELAWDVSKKTGRTNTQILAGMEIAELWRVMGRPNRSEPYLEEMLALPGSDRLVLTLKRAQNAVDGPQGVAELRWRELATLAAERGRIDLQVRALNQLGRFARLREAWVETVSRFQEADALDAAQPRSPSAWFSYSEALSKLERFTEARTALERALRATDPKVDPKIAADFEDARATVLARLGEPAAAYAALRNAQTLRAQAPTAVVRMAATRQVAATPVVDTQQAAALAAVRNELREAELARAKLQERNAVVLAAGGGLLAIALGVAYFYKRRAASALGLAKEAAELRAERSHWQMLRYQLNPHFLYNALASLSGLIVTDPAAARRTVGRLSDFCRLALQRSTGDLRGVDEELQLLAAFLDVEQAGAGERLRVRFDIDPAARSGLLPPFLLQPLAENALKYGEPNADDVREVVISARREPDTLLLEVANTGIWIEPSTSMPRPVGSGSSLGLANVRERLGRLGPRASLAIVAAEGWVRLRVTLPWLKSDALAEIARDVK